MIQRFISCIEYMIIAKKIFFINFLFIFNLFNNLIEIYIISFVSFFYIICHIFNDFSVRFFRIVIYNKIIYFFIFFIIIRFRCYNYDRARLHVLYKLVLIRNKDVKRSLSFHFRKNWKT